MKDHFGHGSVSLQVVLHPRTSNDILFNYADVIFWSKSAWGGWQMEDADQRLEFKLTPRLGLNDSYNTASLTDNMSILWTMPSLSVAPSSLDFGGVEVSITSEAQSVTLSNVSGSNIDISNVTASGDFAVQSDQCTGLLAATDTCAIGVTFTPTAGGTRNGELTINSTPGGEQRISLVGSGLAPVVCFLL